MEKNKAKSLIFAPVFGADVSPEQDLARHIHTGQQGYMTNKKNGRASASLAVSCSR
jgi:hypothetical protein